MRASPWPRSSCRRASSRRIRSSGGSRCTPATPPSGYRWWPGPGEGRPGEGRSFDLRVAYQGCAEDGICYPPITKTVAVTLPPRENMNEGGSSLATGTATALSPEDSLAQRLAGGETMWTLLCFVGFGLLLSFTPCVFPMIPILSGIVVGQGERITTGRAFSLSLVFVLMMAATYAGMGVIAGLFGHNLQATFQDPWVLSIFAGVFIVLGLSMFGVLNLQVPAAWQGRIAELSGRQRGGTWGGVAAMGFFSALIVGPCVAPPLAGALIYIGRSGDALLGGMALFALGLGMGIPLLAVGVSAGKLLPRAGAWMEKVKAVFGVLMLGVAIWLLERLLPAPVTVLLWGLLILGLGHLPRGPRSLRYRPFAHRAPVEGSRARAPRVRIGAGGRRRGWGHRCLESTCAADRRPFAEFGVRCHQGAGRSRGGARFGPVRRAGRSCWTSMRTGVSSAKSWNVTRSRMTASKTACHGSCASGGCHRQRRHRSKALERPRGVRAAGLDILWTGWDRTAPGAHRRVHRSSAVPRAPRWGPEPVTGAPRFAAVALVLVLAAVLGRVAYDRGLRKRPECCR